jgi:tetrapyrrole methylase family protein/MazG family protein
VWLATLPAETLTSLQIARAAHAATQHYPLLDPGQRVLLLGPARAEEIARLAAVLGLAYPPEHPVRVLGALDAVATVGGLATMDALDEGAVLWVAPLAGASTYEALQDIAAHLRAPEGCPWDRELTWARLRAHLLEETHELLAALDAGDARKVSEELGDLLLQVAMQTQIAAEEGRFRFPDVARQIVDKLIRRHPHVFGDTVVSGTDEVLANWEAIKRTERQNSGEKKSPLSGIPAGLPALAQADAYLDRISRLETTNTTANPVTGAPWEILAASDTSVTAEQVGEALFGLVAWARARGIEAESALREANLRFAARVAAQDEDYAPQ